MTPDLMADALLAIIYISSFCVVLGVLGFISDYVIPKFPKVERFLFRMFGLDPDDFEDDYEEEGGVR